jgi:protein-tyrosine-phosphatase
MEACTVLFLCTGNSARSIFAEAAANDPEIGLKRLRAYSAGSHPTGMVNPMTLAVLREERVSTDGLRSKSWDEFSEPDAPRLDLVITVCDQAAAETCPHWAGGPMTKHWGVPDPAAAHGTDERRRRAFREAFLVLKRRVERLASLPLETMDREALADELERIGQA